MHFEFLVEDQSGKVALNHLVPLILNSSPATFYIHSYKGIGRIPKNLNKSSDPAKRILLSQLPNLLRGYGRTFRKYPSNYPAVVVVVCDLDNRDPNKFLHELNKVLNNCSPKPKTLFCLAAEEGEAWLLGDIEAVKQAYPAAKTSILNSYINDSICGTWELLADAVYEGGSKKLKSQGWMSIGKIKSEWAERISPHIAIDSNNSPSFQEFHNYLRRLLSEEDTQ